MNTNRPENATEFQIYGIVPYDRINGSYSLILKDAEGEGTMVSLLIGSPEAQSIAIFLEGVELDRPFTHDLLCNVLMDRSIDVDYVVIDDTDNQTFFASIVFNDGVAMDCRPSDGISIAIRLGSPIFVDNDIVDAMSFDYKNVKGMEDAPAEQIEKTPEKKKSQPKKKQKDESLEVSREELKKRMQEAVLKEDYELAAKLGDMINGK